MKVQSSSPPYDGTAEEKYRYAQYLRYDEKCPQDAILWYNLAEQLGHTGSDIVATCHCERAALAEVVLDIDDQ